MAVINGNYMLLVLDGNTLGCTKSVTLNVNADISDASCKSSNGWAYGIIGQTSWDVSFDGLFDPDGTTNFTTLLDEMIEKDSTLIAEIAEVDGTGGGVVWRGNILVSSMSLTADMNTPATYSGTFTGNGPIYKSTVATS